MEARLLRAVAATALLLCCTGASYPTPNFVVHTADPRLAEQFAKVAEKCRHDLAIEWTGQAMPQWSQPCVVTVQVGPHLGAGGATTFVFDRGEVSGWRMNIQGSAERVQDSVLPHEITHMIFACALREPVPRWADEGAATSVEHPLEQAKHRRMLVTFLQTGRGIPFNQMFAMTEYPPDVMPLYAQAYSTVDYLIELKGRREFLAYVTEGVKTHEWPAATLRHYGTQDLGTLQTRWVAWVAQGCPRMAPAVQPAAPTEAPGPATLLASDTRLPRPEPNLILRTARPAGMKPAPSEELKPIPGVPPIQIAGATAGAPAAASAGEAPSPGPLRTQLTRPQPINQPRQIILEWSGR
jgi:hypothetical protein